MIFNDLNGTVLDGERVAIDIRFADGKQLQGLESGRSFLEIMLYINFRNRLPPNSIRFPPDGYLVDAEGVDIGGLTLNGYSQSVTGLQRYSSFITLQPGTPFAGGHIEFVLSDNPPLNVVESRIRVVGDVPFLVVPEPGSGLLLIAGACALRAVCSPRQRR